MAAAMVAGLALFYWVTAADNLSETDDVYAFAYRAENFSLDHFSDPRLLLYHVAMRLLYLGASAVGWDVSALSLMRAVSALSAAGSLLLVMRIAVRDLRLSAVCGLLAALLLGVCYGFWRYAAEAEVYAPATFLILLVFHGLVAEASEDRGGWSPGLLRGAAWGVVAGLTVLFYQPSVIALFFAFPWLLFQRGRIGALAAYLVFGGAVTASGYLAGYLAYWPEPLSLGALNSFLSQRSGEFMVPPLSLRTVAVSIIRAAFALGHDIASANWIFAFDPLLHLVQRMFSANVLTEEAFLARQAGFLAYLPLISLLALMGLAIRLLPSLWPLPAGLFRSRPVLVIVLWAGINGAIVGRLNPAGVEAWTMLLPPLVLLFAAFAIEPSVRKGNGRAIAALAAVLLVHNTIGGMALVWDPAADYDRVKGAWVIDQTTDEDLVIVAENANLVEALRYLSPAQVALIAKRDVPDVAQSLLQRDLSGLYVRTRGRDFENYILSHLIGSTAAAGGRVIVFSDFFEPPERRAGTFWPDFSAAAALRESARQVHEAAGVGATYVLPVPSD